MWYGNPTEHSEVYGTMALKLMLGRLGYGRAGWNAVTGYCGERCFVCS
jgi:hypothetical protein